MKPVRSVVTGHDRTGRSAVLLDHKVEAQSLMLAPGMGIAQLWRTDEPTLPALASGTTGLPYFPRPGGFSFVVVTLPPDAAPPSVTDINEAVLEAEAKFPGMVHVMEPDHPGMHTTDTIDMGVVLSGRVVIEVGDSGSVLLEAGDCFVQNGARHAFRVPFAEPCSMAVVMVGALRESLPVSPTAEAADVQG